MDLTPQKARAIKEVVGAIAAAMIGAGIVPQDWAGFLLGFFN